MVKACELEKIAQSQYSPGIIDNNEDLLRLIFSPIHWNEENKMVVPAAFQRRELSERGVSVQRRRYTSRDFIAKRTDQIGQPRSGKRFVGIISAKCDSIRKIQDDKCQQCFSVLDTSLNDNIGHADIYFSQSYGRLSPRLSTSESHIVSPVNIPEEESRGSHHLQQEELLLFRFP